MLFRSPRTVGLVCDVLDHHDSPVRPSPRQVLRAQLDRLAAAGMAAFVGTELEFIVFQDSYEEAWMSGYRDLTPANLPIAGAHGVTDGRMTIILLPWSIKDYADTATVGPGMEYIGFKVENLDQLKQDIEKVGEGNPLLTPSPVGRGDEGKGRLELLQRNSLGSWHIADPDGIFLDIVG